jgi:hypothetical protein
LLTLNGGTSTLNFDQTTNGVTNVLGSLTVNGGAQATLGNALHLYNTLSVNQGATLDLAAKSLTLKSIATLTARIAEIKGTLSNATNVTVERFIPASRRYRLLTSPVAGTTINAAWQEGRTWSGGAPDNATPNFGTLITGEAQGSASTATQNGFDFWGSISTASVMKYTGSFSPSSNLGATWTPLSSTKTAGFTGGEAYLLFVRGDRTVTNGTPNNTTLRARGQLREQSANYAVSAQVLKQSHSLIGNPFASPLNFKALCEDVANNTVIEPYFWTWQASLGSWFGGYVLMRPNGSGGYEAIPYGSTTATAADAVISSGQGFFVVPKATATLPASITIKQSHKAAGNAMVSVFRQQGSGPSKLYINLFGEVDGAKTLLDGALAEYHTAAGSSDIQKAVNGSENLSIWKEGSNAIVASGSALPRPGDVVQLRMWNLAVQKSYVFEIQSQRFSVPGLSAWLLDKYLQRETPLNLQQATTSYSFAVTAEQGSRDPMRFQVVFRAQAAPLPPVLTHFHAVETSGGVQLDWNVEQQRSIANYVVEKSSDGNRFTTLASIAARGGAGAQAYQHLDQHPFPVTYYRIKLVGTGGPSAYSSQARVEVACSGKGAVKIYPTVSKGDVTVSLPAGAEGSIINVLNSLGQPVHSERGNTTTRRLALHNLKDGVYYIQVVSSSDVQATQKIVLAK